MAIEGDISEDLVEQLKAADDRYSMIEGAIEIETEITNSKFWSICLTLINEDAQKALEELANVTPSDTQAIVNYQARVYRARFIRDTFEAIRRKGAAAQASLERDRMVSED